MSLLPVYDPKEQQLPVVKSFCFHLLLSITIVTSSYKGLGVYLGKWYSNLSWKYFPHKNNPAQIIVVLKL